MDWIIFVSLTLAGLLLGGLLIGLIASRKLAALTAEITPLRKAAGERDQAMHDLAKAEGRLTLAEQDHAELQTARSDLTRLHSDAATLRANLASAQSAHNAQIEQLTHLRQEMQDQFQLLAGKALQSNAEGFLQQATQIFEKQKVQTSADLDQRAKQIAELVTPLGDVLKSYEVQLKEIELVRAQNHGGITEALQAVRSQHEEIRNVTSNLVNALKASPKTRGRWGEETLRRVMEMSGMVEYCDFETEKHFQGEESQRPDVVIHVAGSRSIVVDAKAPVTAYLEAVSATSEEERNLLLTRHAAQLRERLRNLSSKSYWSKLTGSPDCVVMFVPGDNFVAAAFERDPSLFEDGVQARVLICTPTTFIALAKAISFGWRQERLQANAEEISRLGKELYSRLSAMGSHVAGMGKALKNSVDTYNKFIGSLESSVLPQARRFNELGIEGAKESLPDMTAVDVLVREPAGRDLRLGHELEPEKKPVPPLRLS